MSEAVASEAPLTHLQSLLRTLLDDPVQTESVKQKTLLGTIESWNIITVASDSYKLTLHLYPDGRFRITTIVHLEEKELLKVLEQFEDLGFNVDIDVDRLIAVKNMCTVDIQIVRKVAQLLRGLKK